MPGTRGNGVISIGECMVELARGADGRFGLSYGGDTFNTAVYMARAGLPVSYATLLGDDPYSDGITALAHAEGIGTDLAGRLTGRNAGLYLIETSGAGERSFHYWRDRAPARDLFETAHGDAVAKAITHARLVYFSGITLSLYSPAALDKLADALIAARRSGVVVAMDGNYRPRGWGGDSTRARGVFERFWRLADIALPSLEDDALLWGEAAPGASVARLAAWGAGEIVLKCASAPAISYANGTSSEVPVPAIVTPVDTTAAGDSFNAAYLAARLSGASFAASALAGHRLAGIVVQHRGAIVPREATASAFAA